MSWGPVKSDHHSNTFAELSRFNTVHLFVSVFSFFYFDSIAFRQLTWVVLPGALNSQVQHSSERMDAWETTTHI